MHKKATPEILVVTNAQNATPVFEPFWEALVRYTRTRGARLLAIPSRYKNATSIWNENNEHDEWWARETEPFLSPERETFGHINIYGDISIQPTATRPLSGFEVFSGANSAVFGHPRRQLSTIATAKRSYPRILTTTGSCTIPNYTKSKAGKKSEAHHVFGATVIERSARGLFHTRQINACRDGSFIDLDNEYTARSVRRAERPLGIVYGDIHVDMPDDQVLAATFDRDDSITRRLNPRYGVLGDTLHFGRRSHHTRHNVYEKLARAWGFKKDDVAEEILDAIAFIDARLPRSVKPVAVRDNHGSHFDRWLAEADPRKDDPHNWPFFVKAWDMMNDACRERGEWTPAFQLMYELLGDGRAHFLARDEPFMLGDIECSFHGDKGANGARGSLQNFVKIGVKTIIGHAHTPGILDGCYQVGVTGSDDQDYNDLPSSWMHTHCAVYANGKRSLINVIDGEWCA